MLTAEQVAAIEMRMVVLREQTAKLSLNPDDQTVWRKLLIEWAAQAAAVDVPALLAERARLLARNARLAKVVALYANPEHWEYRRRDQGGIQLNWDHDWESVWNPPTGSSQGWGPARRALNVDKRAADDGASPPAPGGAG